MPGQMAVTEGRTQWLRAGHSETSILKAQFKHIQILLTSYPFTFPCLILPWSLSSLSFFTFSLSPWTHTKLWTIPKGPSLYPVMSLSLHSPPKVCSYWLVLKYFIISAEALLERPRAECPCLWLGCWGCSPCHCTSVLLHVCVDEPLMGQSPSCDSPGSRSVCGDPLHKT